MTLTKHAVSALAKVDDFKIESLDFIGQRHPQLSPGHKAIAYAVIAAVQLPAQGAWAAMSLIFVPVSVTLLASAVGLAMLFESAANDSDDAIDVDAEDVPPTEGITHSPVEVASEPVYEANPFASPSFGGYYKEEVFLSPDDKARSMSVAELDAIVKAVPTELISTDKTPMDIAKYMAMNPKPTLVSAVPRSGKGICLAQMWREFKQLNPSGIVWVIQPKPANSEMGYWDGVDRFWGEMIEDALGNPSEISRITKELTEMVKEWRQQPQRPKMLIIDEAVKIQSVLKRWYLDFLVPTIQVEASSGETDQRFLYVVSQSPLVKDIGISTGNRSSLQLLHIHKPNEDENLGVLRGSFNSIPEPEPELHTLSSSPKQAIFYHTGINDWYPMPAYPVYEPAMATVGVTATQVNEAPPVYPLEKDVWGFEAPSWDFEEETTQTPLLDEKIREFSKLAEEPRYQCVVEFLESLKDHGDGTHLSLSDFGKSSWASRWNGKPGGIKDRSGGAVGVFVRNATKLGFLAEVNEKYQVSLK